MDRLLLAVTTKSPYTQAVMGRQKCEVVCHLVLHGLDLGRKEFAHTPAVRADYVVMMFMIEMMLVIGLVVAEAAFASEAGLGQEFQCAIDRGLADIGVETFHEVIEVLTRQMFFCPEKCLEDQVSLRRPAQPCPLEVL